MLAGQAEGDSSTASHSSTIKLLIATDNHLGYAERDPRRGDDSFTTFEEILRAARVEHDVDAMLLGGDLFHDNKPSLGCMARSCSLLRKYVFGDKPIALSLLSDPARNFPTHAVPCANFQDPNVNIALPIFAIHGNHDDPVGGTSALDILATNGYINYFGHVSSLEEIVVEPVLLRKGNTYIAIYGLGNVRDERLHRCFQLKKVHFVRPKAAHGRQWFSILLLHQNRGIRSAGRKGGIFETMLSGFGLDLVIWGNEHEQMMVPQPSDGFDVVQPGSSILTSLSAHESNPKQYGILEIRGTSYRLTPFPLRSVRPVVRRTVELWRENPTGRTLDAVEDFLRGVVEEMIEDAEQQIKHIPDDVLAFHPYIKLPLMRLAVDFSDAESAPFPQPNLNRFGQQYIDVAANPGELLRPVKPKPERALREMIRSGARGHGVAAGTGDGGSHPHSDFVVPIAPQLHTLDIRTKVAEVFNHNAKDACSLLSEPEVSAAVYAFAEKGEREAIDERIVELLNLAQKAVWRKLGSGTSEQLLVPDVIMTEVTQHKQEINQRYANTLQMELQGGAWQQHEGAALLEEDGGDVDGADKRRRMVSVFDVADSVPARQGGIPDASGHFRDGLPNGMGRSDSSTCGDKDGKTRRRDDGLEELPGDGLAHSSVSAIVANARQQSDEAGPSAKPFKRVRSNERPDMVVDEADNDDVCVVDGPYSSTGRRNTRAKKEAPAAKPGKRVPKSKARANTSAAGGGAPMLSLTHQVVPNPHIAPAASSSSVDDTKSSTVLADRKSGGRGGEGPVLALWTKGNPQAH